MYNHTEKSFMLPDEIASHLFDKEGNLIAINLFSEVLVDTPAKITPSYESPQTINSVDVCAIFHEPYILSDDRFKL